MNASLRRVACLLVTLVAVAVSPTSHAGTVVRFDTNIADFDVELFDSAMPITVANFLSYVTGSSYSSTLIHRSTTYNPTDIQIIQGGGYLLSGNQILSVSTNPPIVLESGTATNVRGTIAMARGTATDSATSQFFFNIQNNPALDGNYAVFGRVVGADGLTALDAIGAVSVYDCSVQLGAAFNELPLTAPSLDPSSLVIVNGIATVPEPSTLALTVTGLAIAAISRRRGAARAG
jgi:peptidyl-prolyl cis-trans isomerase A (cyclophilin A)